MRRLRRASSLPLLIILAITGTASLASAGGVVDRIAYGVDGAESSHGGDPRMWRSEPNGPQGPMQVSAAAAADVGGGDRFDETENRALGRAYLAHMFRRYGSWPDAIAAYNWGPGHLDEWIGGGRPAAKFPAAVERYRTRVMVTSGLAAAAAGDPFSLWANTRLERLERLRMLAKRDMAERRRARGPDAVQLLYADIMRSTIPGAPSNQ
jgi:Transglycosylase SLT domain